MKLTSQEIKLLTPAEYLLFCVADSYPLWDGEEVSSSIKGKPDWRRVERPLPCGCGEIELDFEWNGASVGPVRKLPLFGFPKWKHPIATCRHDKRCNIAGLFKKSHPALYRKLRKFADEQFQIDVGVGGTWWEQKKGYLGVRIGAWV